MSDKETFVYPQYGPYPPEPVEGVTVMEIARLQALLASPNMAPSGNLDLAAWYEETIRDTEASDSATRREAILELGLTRFRDFQKASISELTTLINSNQQPVDLDGFISNQNRAEAYSDLLLQAKKRVALGLSPNPLMVPPSEQQKPPLVDPKKSKSRVPGTGRIEDYGASLRPIDVAEILAISEHTIYRDLMRPDQGRFPFFYKLGNLKREETNPETWKKTPWICSNSALKKYLDSQGKAAT